jgi:hypothetical protein
MKIYFAGSISIDPPLNETTKKAIELLHSNEKNNSNTIDFNVRKLMNTVVNKLNKQGARNSPWKVNQEGTSLYPSGILNIKEAIDWLTAINDVVLRLQNHQVNGIINWFEESVGYQSLLVSNNLICIENEFHMECEIPNMEDVFSGIETLKTEKPHYKEIYVNGETNNVNNHAFIYSKKKDSIYHIILEAVPEGEDVFLNPIYFTKVLDMGDPKSKDCFKSIDLSENSYSEIVSTWLNLVRDHKVLELLKLNSTDESARIARVLAEAGLLHVFNEDE